MGCGCGGGCKVAVLVAVGYGCGVRLFVGSSPRWDGLGPRLAAVIVVS